MLRLIMCKRESLFLYRKSNVIYLKSKITAAPFRYLYFQNTLQFLLSHCFTFRNYYFFQMSNRNKSTGLRFLWIPGKKKQQHKGRYDTTNRGSVPSSHQQRKMEPWSIGGSKGQSELIKSE